ncbi:unnamed protein product [Parascedosporium putredinis]|uniref:Uncharacterized protein n=1 Tax=Parascedosporium putredinis TaxID=1442378 RepID=A0A9P1M703_9PEZI|nr:unnamed protein product [Parascedosporium putredinis]CAI7989483.1 unnamed protein product [Parascedosporium putredinis]
MAKPGAQACADSRDSQQTSDLCSSTCLQRKRLPLTERYRPRFGLDPKTNSDTILAALRETKDTWGCVPFV